MKNDAISRLLQWTPQARAADAHSVYTTKALGSSLEQLEGGAAWLVLGRKGVGKSALIYKLFERCGDRALSRKSEFDPNLLFHRLQFFGASNVNSSGRKVFKLDILLLAADELQLTLPDGGTQKLARKIANYYEGKPIERFISKILGTRVLGKISKTFLGSSELGNAVDKLFGDITYIDRELKNVEGQMRRLCANLPEKKPLYIVFDELDLAIGSVRDLPSYKDYILSLQALLHACSTFDDLRAHGIPVFPIVVLRDDIFAEIGGDDAGKWRRQAVVVDYSAAEIAEILRFRLAAELERAEVPVANDATLEDVWSHYSDSGTVATRGKRTILQMMLQRTLNRPRDIVQFVKELAISARKRPNAASITATDFNRTRPRYGEYFWQEFVDEFSYKYPHFSLIGQTLFEAFWPETKPGVATRVATVKFGVLREKFSTLRQNLRAESIEIGAESDLVNDLVACSILGVRVRSADRYKASFRYMDGIKHVLSSDTELTLHVAVSDYFYLKAGKDSERPQLDFEDGEFLDESPHAGPKE